MRKLSILIMACMLCFCTLGFVGCGKSDNKINVNEVTRSIFYAPLYIALNNGYFADEGLEIQLSVGGGADKSMAALISGAADIGLMGPEAAIYVVQEGTKNNPVVFAQLTKRDGSFIVSKQDEKQTFTWDNLKGETLIGGRKGGVPAMTLQHTIQSLGLEISSTKVPGKVHLRTDVAFDATASTFSNTDAKYCTLFEPAASELVAAGKGHIVASVGEKSGEVPYTAFMATSKYAKKHPENIKKFIKAVVRGYEYLMSASMEDVVKAVKPNYFPSTSDEMITKALENYRNIDAWMETPVMSAAAFNRLQEIMINAGELTSKSKFADVVNNKFAEEVMQEFFSA